MFSRARIERLLGSLLFRIPFAALLLGLHLAAATTLGTQRFDAPFNRAPDSAPAFVDVTNRAAQNWNRLVVARWDSEHYISLALRGYSQCPRMSLKDRDVRPYLPTCTLSFYPGYAFVGYLASIGGRLPIDYTLLGISLLSSMTLLVMWTSRSITSRLGVYGAYLSLLLFNAFTTGFTLVTIQTDPLFLALTLGAYIAFDRRWYGFGALLAGAASGIRVTGAATGFAYGLALLVMTFRERPTSPLRWARRGIELLLPGWGLFAMMAVHQVRLGDPLIYFHAHSQAFGHEVGLKNDPGILLRSIDLPLHEGVFLVLMMLFLLLTHREAMKKFDFGSSVFWYALVATGLGIAMLGSFGLSFAGMNRYFLLAMPIFFGMAMLMKRRPLLLAAWLAFSMWHYWQVDLCFYTSGPGDHSLKQCNDGHWVGRL